MRIGSFVIPAVPAVVKRPWMSRRVFARDPWGNPFSEEAIADPAGTVERMLADGEPVVHRAFRGRCVVLGFDECRVLANHPAASASADMCSLLDEVRPHRNLAPATKAFFRAWILIQDPPGHARLRRLVSRSFTPRRIDAVDWQIEAAATELLDAVDHRSTIEMVSAFNRPFPNRIITSGLHHCLGHSLARAELRLALRAIVERLGDDTIEPGGIDWRVSSILRGPERLVVRRG